MGATKYMIVSGFLGSGKTTSMIAMARVINRKYGKAGIIANDLGAKNLVDADYTRTADVEINEITGDCICYVTEDLVDHIHRLAMMAPVTRIMVRQPNNKGNAGSATNGMPPTSSMGCGTWGGNIVSENISLKHYMNNTWVARPIPEDMPSLQELFGEFYQDGMDVE